MNKTEKLYINSIPVYRTELKDTIKYVLFENDEMIGNVLYISKQVDYIEEYKILLKAIINIVNIKDNYKQGIRTRYEKK